MVWYLGLDGGGTGCRAVLADASGRVIGQGQGGAANIVSDPEAALRAILACAQAALDGRAPGEVCAVLGLAGANIDGAGAWIAARLPFAQAHVLHDAETALSGALGPVRADGAGDGIVAAIGTGSVFSRRIGPEITTIGGWGPVLGDEASGNWIGRRFLSRVLMAEDGRLPHSALSRDALARHGGAMGLVAFARTASAAEFGAELPHLMQAPEDPFAIEVLEAASTAVAAGIADLQPQGRALPVTFTGGLGPVFAARLADSWTIRPAQGTALDGALQLALEMHA